LFSIAGRVAHTRARPRTGEYATWARVMEDPHAKAQGRATAQAHTLQEVFSTKPEVPSLRYPAHMIAHH